MASDVELLYVEGCPNIDATRQAVESTTEGVDVRMVLVEAPDDAHPEFVRPRAECDYPKAVRRRINVSADLGFA